MLLLARLGALNEVFIAEVCRLEGVTPAEMRALGLLARSPEQRASPTAIASSIVQTSGGLTATLKRLERRGFIERSADAHDARKRLVVLTPLGADRHDVLVGALLARYHDVLRDVDLEAAMTAVRELLGPLEAATRARPSAGWAIDAVGVPT